MVKRIKHVWGMYMYLPTKSVDVIIIGAGPAGLSAGCSLINSNLKFLIFEAGLPINERKMLDSHILKGCGGAGLFCDGKFSFFPSSTKLWKLNDDSSLIKSYQWLKRLLSSHKIEIPDYNVVDTNGEYKQNFSEVEKEYKSIHVKFSVRKQIIISISELLSEYLYYSSTVFEIKEDRNGEFDIYIERYNEIEKYHTKFIIFAGGRFGPLSLRKLLIDMPITFRRYEIGIKLEQKNSDWVYAKYPQEDIKIISKYDNISEWRTFCTCRNGKVIKTRWNDILSYSGTGDIRKNGYSNIGINLRYNEIPKNKNIIDEINYIFSGETDCNVISLNKFMNTDKVILGANLDNIFKKKIDSFKINDDINTKIYFPCIEGVGFYPDVNNILKVNSKNIFIAGDSSGIFRGITSAMISGYYCGLQISKLIKLVYPTTPEFIKESPHASMPLVFTAQSKEFFYARDVICEFVLMQNKVPLNPFRIFDYFLNDRVDRNIIRQSNNQLVSFADELWVFGMISDGVLYEIYRARKMHKPIKLFTIGTRLRDIHEIKVAQVKFDPEIHARGLKKEDLILLLDDSVVLKNNQIQCELFDVK